MTTQRRSRRSFGRRTTKRRTSWQQLIFNDIPLLSTGAIVAADLTPQPIRSGGLIHRGGTATIIRSIMNWSLNPTLSGSAQHSAAVGIYVADHEAIIQTAFNDPASDPEQDWYYWTARTIVIDGGSANAQHGISWDVDLRTSRRLRSGYDLLLVMAGFSTNVNTVSITLTMRNLWMIP